jgi:DNA primase catalytic core
MPARSRTRAAVVDERVDPARLVAAHREAARFYRGLLLDPYAGWPRQHLARRRLAHLLEPSSRWQVGYAPRSWKVLVEHLRRRGFGVHELDASGLAMRTHRGTQIDRFRDRVVIPVKDANGDPVGFIGRARPGAPAIVPKYLNSPATSIYRKGELLFGVADQATRLERGAVPVLVEGPMDVVAVDTVAGSRYAAVASCGTAFTQIQASRLRQVARGDAVLVATDADEAGRRAAARAEELLAARFRAVLAPSLPEGSDPSDVLEVGGRSALRAALADTTSLAHQLIGYEVERWNGVLDHLYGQIGATRAVAALVAKLPREQIAGEVEWLARRTGLDLQLITAVLVDAVAPDVPSTVRRRNERSPEVSRGERRCTAETGSPGLTI